MLIRKVWPSQRPHCHIIHKCSPALWEDLLLDGISPKMDNKCDFYKSLNQSLNICGHPICSVLPKSFEKCTKYGKHFIYAPEQTMTCHSTIFIKLKNAQWQGTQILHTKVHPNQSRHAESMSRNSFTSLHTVWQSLSWFSVNSCSLDNFW